MCGIAGILGAGFGLDIRRMISAIRRRGPDAVAAAEGPGWALGAVRLAMLDAHGGVQPFRLGPDGPLLVFNGEIYNHRELRLELEAEGRRFRSRSDAEVALQLYEAAGPSGLRRLEGMFALAVLDGDVLVLARDALGIKPLYYATAERNESFVFGSEIKALLQAGGPRPTLDLHTLADFLALRQPHGDATLFKGVRLVPAGCALTVRFSGRGVELVSCEPFVVRPPLERAPAEMSWAEAEAALDEALLRSVTRHLDADVEIGLSLSGGLDSTVLALAARRARPDLRLRTFTAAPVGAHHPDGVQAALVAERVGTRHACVHVSFEEQLAALPATLAATEAPDAFAGVPFYLLCQRMRGVIKGCLNGEGADELFGGYQEYLDPAYMIERLDRGAALSRAGSLPGSAAAEALRAELVAAAEAGSEAYAEAVWRWNLGGQLERHHLEPVDKIAMAAGVEMRVPYLDPLITDVVRRVPFRFLVDVRLGTQKFLLRRHLVERYGLEFFDVALREKRSMPSCADGFATGFASLCDRLISDAVVAKHPFGPCFRSKAQLAAFDLFHRIFFTYRGDAELLGPPADFLAERYDHAWRDTT